MPIFTCIFAPDCNQNIGNWCDFPGFIGLFADWIFYVFKFIKYDFVLLVDGI